MQKSCTYTNKTNKTKTQPKERRAPFTCIPLRSLDPAARPCALSARREPQSACAHPRAQGCEARPVSLSAGCGVRPEECGCSLVPQGTARLRHIQQRCGTLTSDSWSSFVTWPDDALESVLPSGTRSGLGSVQRFVSFRFNLKPLRSFLQCHKNTVPSLLLFSNRR